MRTFAITLLLAPLLLAAQRYDPLHPPDTYRNADNPYYWRNDPPVPGYWQQDVHYRIRARLDETTDAVDGHIDLTYWNNSPDTLPFVFFHLYEEAYNKGSYMDMQNGDHDPGRMGDPQHPAGTEVRSMQVNGAELSREQDNTVLKAWLPVPLPPGGKIVLSIDFRTHWLMGLYRRMKLFDAWGFKHYDGVHWYPRISVYDRKMGWDTQQHLGHEFYGDYGCYDVELDMPNDQVVEATGWLQDPDEVLPADLRARLDIRNFKDKPWDEKPSVVTPYVAGERKVWRYHAENVHDFAFTCDPTYRIGEAEWNGVKCIAMAEEPHASKWQNAAEYAAQVIRTHSEQIGMYIYPKMVVADARDGMEYPMLTLDSGNEPNYRSLFMHEEGHNWFFGMVGNNETYRAMLDEGFTQFLTGWGLEHLDGDTMVAEPARSAWVRHYSKPQLARESQVYYGYSRDAVRREVPPIDVHSDAFSNVEGLGRGYAHVYYKTAVMLYNLQYVLGDERFIAAMRHYFDQWKVRHPYIEDFRESIISFTHVDLNWFFDEWIDTDWEIDYAVKGIRHRGRDSGQVVHLRRRGRMQMPIDLQVVARDGTVHDYLIPNTWYQKGTDATVLPRWIGFADLQPDYYAHIDVPSGIRSVTIDPTDRLADRYKLNDQRPPPIDISLDHQVENRPDRRTYEGFARPELWWNGYDGVKVGGHFHGDYLGWKHKLWFTAWMSTGLGQYLREGGVDPSYDLLSFILKYETGTERILRGSSVHFDVRLLDGLEQYAGGAQWRLPDGRTRITLDGKVFLRRDSTALKYLLYPEEWELNKVNSVVDLGWHHDYSDRYGGGAIEVVLRSSSIGSDNGYAQMHAQLVNDDAFGKLRLRSRWFAQYGTGATPRESALFLAGASPEEMMDDKFVRSVGMVPYEWTGYGPGTDHFQQGGGLNLRGYAGYLAPEETPTNGTTLTYRGNSGASVSEELELDGLIPLHPPWLRDHFHVDIYLFGDAGTMGYRYTDEGRTRFTFGGLRADAGMGTALTIKNWGPFQKLKPLVLRFDMPLVLNAIPATENDHVAFRYVVGVGRCF
ncbi:MAG: M1 family metallopeptidase [Flavobacteriales bacterium]|nr:M1 family metallopeptidase [Flavobacteriales bacterium]